MTTTALQKPPGWSKREPYELARQVASRWWGDVPRVRETHASLIAGRSAKARGYQQKIRILAAEPAMAEVIHERTQHGQEAVQAIFRSLKEKWVKETAFASATVDIVLNDSYQQIIGLGPVALPLILRELEQNGGQWFWALRMIARHDPVPKELRGKTKRMAEAWINWAKEQGII